MSSDTQRGTIFFWMTRFDIMMPTKMTYSPSHDQFSMAKVMRFFTTIRDDESKSGRPFVRLWRKARYPKLWAFRANSPNPSSQSCLIDSLERRVQGHHNIEVVGQCMQTSCYQLVPQPISAIQLWCLLLSREAAHDEYDILMACSIRNHGRCTNGWLHVFRVSEGLSQVVVIENQSLKRDNFPISGAIQSSLLAILAFKERRRPAGLPQGPQGWRTKCADRHVLLFYGPTLE